MGGLETGTDIGAMLVETGAALAAEGLGPGTGAVLDLGCGWGAWSLAAARLCPGARIVALDPVRETVEEARRTAAGLGVRPEFMVGNLEEAEAVLPGQRFPVILCNSVLSYLDPETAFGVMTRLLSTGGRIIMYHNHLPAYYLMRSWQSLQRGDLSRLYYYSSPLVLNPLRRILTGRRLERYVTRRMLQGLAERHGLRMREVPNFSMYQRTFWGLPVALSVVMEHA